MSIGGMVTDSTSRISRDDLVAKLKSMAGDVDDDVQENRSTLLSSGIAVVVIVALLAYLFGVRRGKKKSALVEIRRL